jgi:putative exporter of polyketide antibiotics
VAGGGHSALRSIITPPGPDINLEILPQELVSLSVLAHPYVLGAAVAHPLAILAVVSAFLGVLALLGRRIYRRLWRDPPPP